MTPNITDYQLSAARAAHAHLCRLQDGVRVQVIHAWLVENRSHFKAKEVDVFLSIHRLSGDRSALEQAEILVERYLGV